MATAHITLARLRELQEYVPDTGLFIWRAKTSNYSRVIIGNVAGTLHPFGYIIIKIDGRDYRAHRLAFFYMVGVWPTAEIDHIDGNRANNKWNNLREATKSENQQNRRIARSDNKCGVLGVYWCKHNKKWKSEICLDGKKKSLGYFSTCDAAHAAYLAAKRNFHPFCPR